MEATDAAHRRLSEALGRIASGELDECPICMDVPAPKDARVLRCCAAIMCRACIPQCKGNCPFCREPLLKGEVDDDVEEGESPYSYTTQDYSKHTDYCASIDYTVTRNYTSHAYSPQRSYRSKEYTSKDYSAPSTYATKDYSIGTASYSSSTNYTSTNYTSNNYTASHDYSISSAKYSGSDCHDKYSGIGDKYSSSSSSSSAQT